MAFSGKYNVKFWNVVNFQGKYHKHWGISIIFLQYHVKFEHFVNFSYIIFGQCLAPTPKVG